MTQAPPKPGELDARLRPPILDAKPAAPAKPTNPALPSQILRASSPFPASIDDKATASYVRRTLCAHHAISGGAPRSIHDLLPPLTSSNDIDLQLYAIIAVLLKEFVQAWYSKVTPDHIFVDEILQTIAHCTRALEERLRSIDLEALLLDELPRLVDGHVLAFRMAHDSHYPHPLASTPRSIYHTLHPHPAMAPVPKALDPTSIVEQERNEQAWRQLLVQGVLAVLLPTEDLQNRCLRALVGEILAEMIVGNVLSQKLCEGPALWDMITHIIEAVQDRGNKAGERSSNKKKNGRLISEATNDSVRISTSRLEQFGLLNKATAGNAAVEQAGIATPKIPRTRAFANTFWLVVNYGLLAFTAVRAVILALMSSANLRSRGNARWPTETERQGQPRPLVSMSVWSTTANVVELSARMPWLFGLISLAQRAMVAGPGKVGDTDGMLDRLLGHQIQSRLLNVAHIPPMLRTIRRTFFPSNTFSPNPKPAPSAAEVSAIKATCANAILDLFPPLARKTYFADAHRDVQLAQVGSWLDVLGDPYMNKHLIFAILELFVVRLVPELKETGPEELLKERGTRS